TNSLVRNLVFSPDSRLLLVARRVAEGPLTLAAYDLRSHLIAFTVPLRAQPYATSFDSSGTRLAMTSHESGHVEILDPSTGLHLENLDLRPHTTYGLAWHPTEPRLAIGAGDRLVHLWNLGTHPPTEETLDNGGVATQLCFSPDGSLLATAGWNNQVR